MASNYDNSASFYDGLSRLVFGDALKKAQTYFLPQIPSGAHVLIVGGGTGWIMEEITHVHPSGLSLTYVEISARMMARSQKRNIGRNKAVFINQPIEAVQFPARFDVIITPFLFDNYKEDSLAVAFQHIHPMLKQGGIWLNTDFQLTGQWWQQVILKSMLLFFKVLCSVESWRLPDVGTKFKKAGYLLREQKTFFKEFVVTRMYVK